MATFAEAASDLESLESEIESARIVTEADRLAGAEFIRSRILDRTAAGIDAKGNGFQPYSVRYWARKADAGGCTDIVDLYGIEHHPHMLNALLSKVSARGFEVGFYDDEPADRARWNNEGTGRVPARRFFDVNEQDLADVHELIGKRISARLGRASLGNLGSAIEE
jgi:hypothetical protein